LTNVHESIIQIRQAEPRDAAHVSSILCEAAEWLESIGQPLWQPEELTPESIANDVGAGLHFVEWNSNDPVGVVRFQLRDDMFWPDVPEGESAFIHRLAVRRSVAGIGLSKQMLDWAKARTRSFGLRFLRLDCVPRPKLCAVYERNGFTKHSEYQAGPYYVVRYECDTRSRA